jgi:MFS family permease
MGAPSEGAAGILMMAYSIPMILTAPIHGFVGQKMGRKRALRFYLLWQILGVAVFAFLLVPGSYQGYSTLYVMLNLAFISIPWMGVIVHSFPIIWTLAPEGKLGSYMGVYYFFNQLAYTLSPIFMGVLLDVFIFLGSYRFIIMFPYVLLCLVIAFMFFFGVKHGEVGNIPSAVP